jgi:hypothetical protein
MLKIRTELMKKRPCTAWLDIARDVLAVAATLRGRTSGYSLTTTEWSTLAPSRRDRREASLNRAAQED